MNTHSLFSYDFPKRSIIASATTLKKARNPQSAECKMLLRMMSEHPDFEVAEKTIQKKPSKQTYKGLTFGTMEDYIQTQDNSKKQLAVYQAVRRMAKIPTTKKRQSPSRSFTHFFQKKKQVWYRLRTPQIFDGGRAKQCVSRM